MYKIIAIIVMATGLAACDMISTLTNGMRHVSAVEAALQLQTGLKPDVGFNWRNGRLVLVTVTFPRLYERKPLRALSEDVKAVVRQEFEQTPEKIVLGFALDKEPTPEAVQTGGERI
ncbi:MAG TPA: hypothetical protein VL492_06780 [Methylovirgula sp.]|jgi:hypothetical protein|nr:hypothetical protein [Methylovirgula sp.]